MEAARKLFGWKVVVTRHSGEEIDCDGLWSETALVIEGTTNMIPNQAAMHNSEMATTFYSEIGHAIMLDGGISAAFGPAGDSLNMPVRFEFCKQSMSAWIECSTRRIGGLGGQQSGYTVGLCVEYNGWEIAEDDKVNVENFLNIFESTFNHNWTYGHHTDIPCSSCETMIENVVIRDENDKRQGTYNFECEYCGTKNSGTVGFNSYTRKYSHMTDAQAAEIGFSLID